MVSFGLRPRCGLLSGWFTTTLTISLEGSIVPTMSKVEHKLRVSLSWCFFCSSTGLSFIIVIDLSVFLSNQFPKFFNFFLLWINLRNWISRLFRITIVHCFIIKWNFDYFILKMSWPLEIPFFSRFIDYRWNMTDSFLNKLDEKSYNWMIICTYTIIQLKIQIELQILTFGVVLLIN